MARAHLTSFLDEGPSPPGWDGNPSAWRERLVVLGLAVTGLGIALYLGLFQLQVLTTAWEPFFGEGTRKVVLGSSRYLPIPDALLGVFAYLLDIVFGAIGGQERWRTHPWAVLFQGVVVLGLGVGGVLLTIVQWVIFGTFCTLCLCSAACSVLMVGFAAAEVLAALQYLKRVRCQGGKVRQVFWGTLGRAPLRSFASSR